MLLVRGECTAPNCVCSGFAGDHADPNSNCLFRQCGHPGGCHKYVLLSQAPPSRPLDDLSPAGLYQRIIDLTQNFPKEFPWKDTQIVTSLCHNSAHFPAIERKKELDQFLSYADERWERRRQAAQARTEIQQDKNVNSICSTQAPPGAGKSFFLDYIASSRNSWTGSLEGFLPVPVTFNNYMPFQQTGIDQISITSGLATRMLFAAFIDTKIDVPNFSAFCSAMPEKIGVEDAFFCIKQFLNCPGIVLLVDELLKAGGSGDEIIKQQRISEVVTVLGGMLDLHADFFCIVTTLDRYPLKKAVTQSGRKINFISLLRPNLSSYLGLFNENMPILATFEFNLQDLDLSIIPQEELILFQCLSDANGHWRTIETIKTLLSDRQLVDYRSFIEAIIRSNSVIATDIPDDLVIAALTGELLDINKSINGQTIREYIRDGFLINTVDMIQSAIVPEMSVVSLLGWALARISVNPVARIIFEMLLHDASRFTFQSFETFHANWEALQRVIRHQQSINLSWLYGKHRAPTALFSIPNDRQFLVHDKKVLDTKTLPSARSAFIENIVLVDGNQPGFDIITCESTANQVDIGLFIECRFSDPRAKTQLSIREIRTKRQLMEREASRIGFKKPSEQFLIIAAQRSKNASMSSTELPLNTIVLDKDALAVLYSPTLASRPQFLHYCFR